MIQLPLSISNDQIFSRGSIARAQLPGV